MRRGLSPPARADGVPEAHMPTGPFGIGDMRVEDRDAVFIGGEYLVQHHALRLVPALRFDPAEVECGALNCFFCFHVFFPRAG